MKKIILLTLVTIFTTVSLTYAQDVTKFLGIPVKGSKTELIQKLKAKGFKYSYKDDALAGEFNGENVSIIVQTNKKYVSRLVIHYAMNLSEINAIIKYNNLYYQFLNNPNYVFNHGGVIPQNEDISSKISVENKSYQTGFHQKTEKGLVETNNYIFFALHKHIDTYSITLYYENGYNMANGSDL